MKLILARHLWGVTTPYSLAFKKFKEEGYTAIEASLIYLQESKETFFSLLHELDLRWIPMIFTQGKSVAEHIDSFATQVKEVTQYNPLLINAHSGRDAFTRLEAETFYKDALKIEQHYAIPIAHETHRGRVFYNPWITQDILVQFPELKLCCDFSHWVTVCERLIDDEVDILQLCADRCLHIHARVGYEQGPQVPDPRAPEYQNQLEAHERWWNMIWDAQQKAGRSYSTMTPEFGPEPYMPMLPYTNKPVSSLEDICYWQMQRQKENFLKRNK
jgi:sugar phosphate isomerase/epimerase